MPAQESGVSRLNKNGTKRRFKWTSFAETIADIKITAGITAARPNLIAEDTPCLVGTTAAKWALSNRAPTYVQTYKRIRGHTRTLLALLEFKQEVFDDLVRGIQKEDLLSIEALADLLTTFFVDLQGETDAFVFPAIDCMLPLLAHHHADIVNVAVTAVAKLLRYNTRYIMRNAEGLYERVTPYFTASREHTRRFAGEVMAYVVRKLSPGKQADRLYAAMLQVVIDAPKALEGHVELFVSTCITAQKHLHSQTANIVGTLFCAVMNHPESIAAMQACMGNEDAVSTAFGMVLTLLGNSMSAIGRTLENQEEAAALYTTLWQLQPAAPNAEGGDEVVEEERMLYALCYWKLIQTTVHRSKTPSTTTDLVVGHLIALKRTITAEYTAWPAVLRQQFVETLLNTMMLYGQRMQDSHVSVPLAQRKAWNLMLTFLPDLTPGAFCALLSEWFRRPEAAAFGLFSQAIWPKFTQALATYAQAGSEWILPLAVLCYTMPGGASITSYLSPSQRSGAQEALLPTAATDAIRAHVPSAFAAALQAQRYHEALAYIHLIAAVALPFDALRTMHTGIVAAIMASPELAAQPSHTLRWTMLAAAFKALWAAARSASPAMDDAALVDAVVLPLTACAEDMLHRAAPLLTEALPILASLIDEPRVPPMITQLCAVIQHEMEQWDVHTVYNTPLWTAQTAFLARLAPTPLYEAMQAITMLDNSFEMLRDKTLRLTRLSDAHKKYTTPLPRDSRERLRAHRITLNFATFVCTQNLAPLWEPAAKLWRFCTHLLAEEGDAHLLKILDVTHSRDPITLASVQQLAAFKGTFPQRIHLFQEPSIVLAQHKVLEAVPFVRLDIGNFGKLAVGVAMELPSVVTRYPAQVLALVHATCQNLPKGAFALTLDTQHASMHMKPSAAEAAADADADAEEAVAEAMATDEGADDVALSEKEGDVDEPTGAEDETPDVFVTEMDHEITVTPLLTKRQLRQQQWLAALAHWPLTKLDAEHQAAFGHLLQSLIELDGAIQTAALTAIFQSIYPQNGVLLKYREPLEKLTNIRSWRDGILRLDLGEIYAGSAELGPNADMDQFTSILTSLLWGLCHEAHQKSRYTISMRRRTIFQHIASYPGTPVLQAMLQRLNQSAGPLGQSPSMFAARCVPTAIPLTIARHQQLKSLMQFTQNVAVSLSFRLGPHIGPLLDLAMNLAAIMQAGYVHSRYAGDMRHGVHELLHAIFMRPQTAGEASVLQRLPELYTHLVAPYLPLLTEYRFSNVASLLKLLADWCRDARYHAVFDQHPTLLETYVALLAQPKLPAMVATHVLSSIGDLLDLKQSAMEVDGKDASAVVANPFTSDRLLDTTLAHVGAFLRFQEGNVRSPATMQAVDVSIRLAEDLTDAVRLRPIVDLIVPKLRAPTLAAATRTTLCVLFKRYMGIWLSEAHTALTWPWQLTSDALSPVALIAATERYTFDALRTGDASKEDWPCHPDQLSLIKYYYMICAALTILPEIEARQQLIAVVEAMGAALPALAPMAGALKQMNAGQAAGINFNEQFAGLEAAEQLLRSEDTPIHVALLAQLVYALQDEKEFVLRRKVSLILQVYLQEVAAVRPDAAKVFVSYTWAPLRSLIKTAPAPVREEVLAIMGVAITTVADHAEQLRNMRPLMAAADEDEDGDDGTILSNMYHFKADKRMAATRLLCKAILADTFSATTLSQILIPLLTRLLIETPPGPRTHVYLDTLVTCLGEASLRIAWPAFNTLLSELIAHVLSDKMSRISKYFLRIIIRGVDRFHTELQNAASGVSDPQARSKGAHASTSPERIHALVEMLHGIWSDMKDDATNNKFVDQALARVPLASVMARLIVCLPEGQHRSVVADRLLNTLVRYEASRDPGLRRTVRVAIADSVSILGKSYFGLVLKEATHVLRRSFYAHAVPSLVLTMLYRVRMDADDIQALEQPLWELMREDMVGVLDEQRRAPALEGKVHEMRTCTSFTILKYLSASLPVARINAFLAPIRELLLNTMSPQVVRQMRHALSSIRQGLLMPASLAATGGNGETLAKATGQDVLQSDQDLAEDMAATAAAIATEATEATITPIPQDETQAEADEPTAAPKNEARDDDVAAHVASDDLPFDRFALLEFLYHFLSDRSLYRLPESVRTDGPEALKDVHAKRRAAQFQRNVEIVWKRPSEPSVEAVVHTNNFILAEFGLDTLYVLLRDRHMAPQDREQQQCVDPFVSLLGEAIFSEHRSVIHLALRNLNVLAKHWAMLPSFVDFTPALMHQCLKIISRAGNLTSELSSAAMCTLISLLTGSTDDVTVDAPFKKINFAPLLTLCAQSIEQYEMDTQCHAFLRTLINRRLVFSQMYELMETVLAMSITCQSDQVRNVCRDTFVQFMLNYPHEPKSLKRKMLFAVQNLQFPVSYGRQSALALLERLFTRVGIEVMHEYVHIAYSSALLMLANDEDPGCREAAAQFIVSLFRSLDATHTAKLLDWTAHIVDRVETVDTTSTKQPRLLASAGQVYGLIIDSHVFAPTLPAIERGVLRVARLSLDGALKEVDAATLRHVDADGAAGTVSATDGYRWWNAAYMALHAFNKLVKPLTAPQRRALVDRCAATAPLVLEQMVQCVVYPHAWVRRQATRALAATAAAVLEPLKGASVQGEHAAMALPPFLAPGDARLFLAHNLLDVVQSPQMDDAQGTVLAQLFTLLAKLFYYCEAVPSAAATAADASVPTTHKSLVWLLRQLSLLSRRERFTPANAETGTRTKWTSPASRRAIYTAFAAILSALPDAAARAPYAEPVLQAVVRLTAGNAVGGRQAHLHVPEALLGLSPLAGAAPAILRDEQRAAVDLAKEVQNMCASLLDGATYFRLHADVQRDMEETREARKRKLAEKVDQDEAFAEAHKAKRMRNKAEAKARKLKAQRIRNSSGKTL